MIALQATETKDSQQPIVQAKQRLKKTDRILVYVPNTDIIERDDYYHLLLDMPGLNENSIEISCEGTSLTVSGKLDQKNSQGQKVQKPFFHTFYLPLGVSDLGIEAQFFEGTLQVSVLKDDTIANLDDLLEAVIH